MSNVTTVRSAEIGDIRILHVDDEPDFVKLTATFLERERDDFEVITATSVTEGMAHIEEADVDCIVSDYDMPETDGLEFLDSVRSEYLDLPFILFTGKGSEEIASEAISAGVTEYIQKEVGTDQYRVLANRIENAVVQYRTEKALAESERRLGTLLSNLPGMAYRCRNTPDWPVEFVSDGCRELTGYRPVAFEDGSVTLGDIIHPDDREDIWESVQAALADGDPFEVTYRILTEDGTKKWVWEQGRGVFGVDPDGDAIAIEGFVTDITERKEHERTLTTLHETTRALFHATSRETIYENVVETMDTVVGLSYAGVFEWNESSEQLRPVEATTDAEKLFERIPTLDRGEGLVWEAFAAGETRIYEDVSQEDAAYDPEMPIATEVVCPIGGYGVLAIGSPEPDAFSDIEVALAKIVAANTKAALDQVEREGKLAGQNERFEELVSVISHDLRGPLNVAKGQLTLERDERDGARLESIDDALDSIETLIEDMLTLARLDQSIEDVERVSLPDAVESAWSAIETESATMSVDETELGPVDADSRRLEQLLSNLFRFSIERTSHEEGATITVGPLPDGFFVEDDDSGRHVGSETDPSERTRLRPIEDASVELTLVRWIGNAHGWTVEIGESDPGGARFEITGIDRPEDAG